MVSETVSSYNSSNTSLNIKNYNKDTDESLEQLGEEIL